VDALIAELLGDLREAGELEDTLVIVTSDHGEELHEHGQIGHARSLHSELLRVPLVLAGPGVPQGFRCAQPVGLVDLVPTVLELVGIAPAASIEGQSLLPLMRGEPASPARASYRISELEWKLRLRSVWTPTHHLIVQPRFGVARLFDLRLDPSEQRMSFDEQVVEELRAQLGQWRKQRKAQRTREFEEVELSEEKREQLRALGYAD
jgi:arylsulfatase A-like enzyme